MSSLLEQKRSWERALALAAATVTSSHASHCHFATTRPGHVESFIAQWAMGMIQEHANVTIEWDSSGLTSVDSALPCAVWFLRSDACLAVNGKFKSIALSDNLSKLVIFRPQGNDSTSQPDVAITESLHQMSMQEYAASRRHRDAQWKRPTTFGVHVTFHRGFTHAPRMSYSFSDMYTEA